MTRGYLRDSGGAKRLRFVKPGYDADDESVPPNKVIFDSENLGTLSILETGEKTWMSATGSANADSSGALETIRTWSYGFTPLCSFQIQTSIDGDYWGQHLECLASSLNGNKILVSSTGIQVYLRWGTPSRTVRLRWQAYRIPAA